MVRENILELKRRISLVCSKVNRDPALITIVAVSKGRTVDQIKEVLSCGISDIGENRLQEALAKYNGLRTTNYKLRWHMVGHLQTNKVKEAVKIFDLIHSVDSMHLAQELNKQAARLSKVQDILIEVKTSPEVTKFGIKADEVIGVIKEISGLKNISIKGLMTVAPVVADPEQARPYFRQLRELNDKVNESRITNHESRILSMGMTDDFEVAIEEGATIVRLGRAIFEG